MREAWGAALYGDPCDDCTFRWTLSAGEAIELVRLASLAVDALPSRCSGQEGTVGRDWTVTSYVAHMADNLRQWAERMHAGHSAHGRVQGYDPDALAAARGYSSMPLGAAAWSFRVASRDWTEVTRAALASGVVLDHESRGRQSAEDIARNNAHDVRHHLWDIDQILAAYGR